MSKRQCCRECGKTRADGVKLHHDGFRGAHPDGVEALRKEHEAVKKNPWHCNECGEKDFQKVKSLLV